MKLNLQVNSGVGVYYKFQTYTPEEYAWKEDWLADQLLTMDADIVGFQEIFEEQALANVVAETNERAAALSQATIPDRSKRYHRKAIFRRLSVQPYGPSTLAFAPNAADTGEPGKRRPGLATLSRFGFVGEPAVIQDLPKPLEIPFQPLRGLDQDDAGFFRIHRLSRPILKVRVPVGNTQLTVFNCHLKSKLGEFITPPGADFPPEADLTNYDPAGRALGSLRAGLRRMAEAWVLRRMVLEELEQGHPVMVMGDINDGEHSVSSEIISGETPFKNYSWMLKHDARDSGDRYSEVENDLITKATVLDAIGYVVELIHKSDSFLTIEGSFTWPQYFSTPSLHTLSAMTREHIELSETRRQTLCWLIFLITRHATVNLWRLAAHAPSQARTDSVRRRFYRFFQFIHIDGCSMARMVVALTGLSGKPWTLTIDRTNWDLGKVTINILMIAVVWNGIGIPLICTFLPKKGNSSTRERTQLLDRLHQVFPDMKVAMLIGDREFIGGVWMRYLTENKIYFVLRLRDNQLIFRDGYQTWPLSRLAHSLKPGETLRLKEKCHLKDGPSVRIIMKRLTCGELLILACPSNASRALAVYRDRWTIETLFANLKTRGFNLEATHIGNPKKLATLIAIVSIALTLAVKTGLVANRVKPVSIKSHGRKAVSVFALGITCLNRMFAYPDKRPDQAIFEHIIANRRTSKHKLINALKTRV